MSASLLLDVIAAYAAVGVGVALVFVVFGLSRVLPGASATAGARLLLLPGAAALWPLILRRWMEARGGL